MNIEELDALMAKTTDEFNRLKVEEATVNSRLQELDTSLKRLQGEFESYKKIRIILEERMPTIATEQADMTPDPFRSYKKSKTGSKAKFPAEEAINGSN